jgi:hypothetical protein
MVVGRIIMRATLPQAASNTYYGQWTRLFAGESPRNGRSIAHNEGAVRAKFTAVAARGRVFPANRGSTPREIYSGPKKKFSDEPSIGTGSRSSSRPQIIRL